MPYGFILLLKKAQFSAGFDWLEKCCGTLRNIGFRQRLRALRISSLMLC
jgi:hypothetical protein